MPETARPNDDLLLRVIGRLDRHFPDTLERVAVIDLIRIVNFAAEEAH